MQTLEQRLKQIIGEQVFTIAELQRQLEEAQENLKERENSVDLLPKLHAVE